MTDLAFIYAQIDDMVMQLKGFVGQLDTRLSTDVDRQFKNLVTHGWGGAASRAFNDASTTWHTKVGELNTTLTQLHGALSTAGTDMSSTDKSLVSLFG